MSEHARKRARAVLRGRDDGNIILLPDRSYLGWYRHLTLVMLAAAFLVSIRVHESHPLAALSPAPVAVPAPAVIALTTSEIRHLLARLIWPAPTSAALICQWSWWRRTHQYWAGYYHRRRRQKAG